LAFAFFVPHIISFLPFPYDLIIIGGGIVGAATARLLSIKHPQFNYALVEKENSLGNLIIIKVV